MGHGDLYKEPYKNLKSLINLKKCEGIIATKTQPSMQRILNVPILIEKLEKKDKNLCKENITL